LNGDGRIKGDHVGCHHSSLCMDSHSPLDRWILKDCITLLICNRNTIRFYFDKITICYTGKMARSH